MISIIVLLHLQRNRSNWSPSFTSFTSATNRRISSLLFLVLSLKQFLCTNIYVPSHKLSSSSSSSQLGDFFPFPAVLLLLLPIAIKTLAGKLSGIIPFKRRSSSCADKQIKRSARWLPLLTDSMNSQWHVTNKARRTGTRTGHGHGQSPGENGISAEIVKLNGSCAPFNRVVLGIAANNKILRPTGWLADYKDLPMFWSDLCLFRDHLFNSGAFTGRGGQGGRGGEGTAENNFISFQISRAIMIYRSGAKQFSRLVIRLAVPTNYLRHCPSSSRGEAGLLVGQAIAEAEEEDGQYLLVSQFRTRTRRNLLL